VTQTTKQHLLRKAAGLLGKEELAGASEHFKIANVLDAWVASQTKPQ
jgi:hypothetical protein